MANTIQEIQDQIIQEFSVFEDRMDKYEYIIELGKELEGIEEDKKVEEALVKGCQSKVWLHASREGDHIHFDVDSDAFIVRGLVALLAKVLSDQPIEDVAQADIYFIDEIGLQEMLSPTRANGLNSMLKQMKLYSIALQANN